MGDAKTKFILGICGFLTSFAALLGTLEHGYSDLQHPKTVGAILVMAASFVMTAYGGANFTPQNVQQQITTRAIDRVHEHLAAQERAGTPASPGAAVTLRLAATEEVATVAAAAQGASPPHSYFVLQDGVAKRLTQEGFERVLKAAARELPQPMPAPDEGRL